ncbi:DUF4249 family protein [Chitinophaga silvatica]|nr:DUF4249 family protein [Chitinophaga silvatica]
MRLILLGTLTVFLFSACEKDISVHVQTSVPQLVVEGIIENNNYPQVILTHSLNYFSSIDSLTLINMYVHDATVSVSTGVKTMELKEQKAFSPSGAEYYVYRPELGQPGDLFKGKSGETYTLQISTDNKTYKAVTSIPLTGMHLDSLWATKVLLDNDTTKVRLWARITDNPTSNNYVRYFTKVNRRPFLPSLNSVIDDHIVNGTTFEIPLDAGVDRNTKPDPVTYALFSRGDTITLKFCNIDNSTWDFWRTVDYAFNTNGNPFSSPTRIIGNVNGALGYWGGYEVSYKTIYIRK